jgi:hypothetical protein
MTNFLENCLFCADLPKEHRFKIRPLGQICFWKNDWIFPAGSLKVSQLANLGELYNEPLTAA